jgi:hypothetical protein
MAGLAAFLSSIPVSNLIIYFCPNHQEKFLYIYSRLVHGFFIGLAFHFTPFPEICLDDHCCPDSMKETTALYLASQKTLDYVGCLDLR